VFFTDRASGLRDSPLTLPGNTAAVSRALHSIARDEVGKLVAEGAQLVEVLPAEEFEDAHLPGAINIPLERLDEAAVRDLDRDLPVVVYCADYQ
jgi:phage shock protein E